MNEERLSLVRVKMRFLNRFAIIFSISLLLIDKFFHYEMNEYEFWFIFIFMGFMGMYALNVKCERCGNLAYRIDSKFHGLPKAGYFFDQPKNCPLCGFERK